jgi:hypothetical protein
VDANVKRSIIRFDGLCRGGKCAVLVRVPSMLWMFKMDVVLAFAFFNHWPAPNNGSDCERRSRMRAASMSASVILVPLTQCDAARTAIL